MSMTVEEAQVPVRAPKPAPPTPASIFAQFSLKGRVAAITGAAEGIGLAVAEAYAEAGADLALLYNSNPAAISKAADLATTYGVRAKAYRVNVTQADEVERVINEAAADFGRLDIFVANAGMAISKGVLDMSVDEYRALQAVNVDGVFFCAKYAGAVFQRQGFGNLILTSSISAHVVNVPVDQPVYNAGKAFVSHLGKSLAREWRDFARVNVVSPGFFGTKMGAGELVRSEANRMTVLGRQGETRELKGVFLLLASDAGSYCTGADVIVDGGYTLP